MLHLGAVKGIINIIVNVTMLKSLCMDFCINNRSNKSNCYCSCLVNSVPDILAACQLVDTCRLTRKLLYGSLPVCVRAFVAEFVMVSQS